MLLVAAVPLGNPGDASPRLRAALSEADVVAAEDTRRTRRLATDLGVTIGGRLVSHWDAVERTRLPELLEVLRGGGTVLLVTDAGTPAVSDPGYLLVAAAVEEDLSVSVLPGPSAVTAAVAVAGIPCERFCFEGFPPRKPEARRRAFTALATEPRAMVFFEAPHRLADTLAAMATAFGEQRPGAVCRELTKTYEEVRRGSLGELAAWARDVSPRGEITVVVAGATRGPVRDWDEQALASLVEERVAEGATRRDAVAEVAAATGVARRLVYRAATR